jgi:hypothetical protein
MVNSINYKTNRPLWNFDVQYFNNSELWPTNHTYLPIEQNDQPTNKTPVIHKPTHFTHLKIRPTLDGNP